MRLPRPILLRRSLSIADVAFAARLQSPALLRLMLQDRQRLIREWLRVSGLGATRLYRTRVRALRRAAGVDLAREMKLLIEFCAFWIIYEIMCGLVRFYGPFRTDALLRSLQALGAALSNLSGRIADRGN